MNCNIVPYDYNGFLETKKIYISISLHYNKLCPRDDLKIDSRIKCFEEKINGKNIIIYKKHEFDDGWTHSNYEEDKDRTLNFKDIEHLWDDIDFEWDNKTNLPILTFSRYEYFYSEIEVFNDERDFYTNAIRNTQDETTFNNITFIFKAKLVEDNSF
jgi:hypothetical protein